jgi:hypothetical protein
MRPMLVSVSPVLLVAESPSASIHSQMLPARLPSRNSHTTAAVACR